MSEPKPTGLGLLRAPFPAHQISKLPKESKAQADERKSNRHTAITCTVCGGWHHKYAVHLDYVGHAALTDRLLDCDMEWSWQPVADPASLGLPASVGGMWITLTVCGVTRLGYGHAGDKVGGDAVKEIIGDALRNAAMRFGAALDLWHKGDLHMADEDDDGNAASVTSKSSAIADVPKMVKPAGYDDWRDDFVASAETGLDALKAAWAETSDDIRGYWLACEPKDAREKLRAKAAAVTVHA